jgi:hypothetical protein
LRNQKRSHGCHLHPTVQHYDPMSLPAFDAHFFTYILSKS